MSDKPQVEQRIGLDDQITQFIHWEQASRDTIDFKKAYVDMAGDLVAGLVLSQIIYWHLPGRNNVTKLRVEQDGKHWVARNRKEWWDEIRITPKQLDRALKILRAKNLVETGNWFFDGKKTLHVRLDWHGFLPLFMQSILPKGEDTILPKGKKGGGTKLPKGENAFYPKVKNITENTYIDHSTENTDLANVANASSLAPSPTPEDFTASLAKHGVAQGATALGVLGSAQATTEQGASPTPPPVPPAPPAPETSGAWELINVETGEIVETFTNPITAKKRRGELNAIGGAKYVTRAVKPNKPDKQPPQYGDVFKALVECYWGIPLAAAPDVTKDRAGKVAKKLLKNFPTATADEVCQSAKDYRAKSDADMPLGETTMPDWFARWRNNGSNPGAPNGKRPDESDEQYWERRDREQSERWGPQYKRTT